MSVVVPAFNEARHVGRCVRSLLEQEPPPVEVIVVDDGSTDQTAHQAQVAGAKVIGQDHQGPAASKNRGAAEARGEILVFFDADMAAEPGFLAALTRPICTGEATGTFTGDIYLGNPESIWARCYAKIRGLGIPHLLAGQTKDRSANYRAVRRNAFLAVGGYDNVGYGEDMTLAPKLGTLAVRADAARCLHFNPDSLREIFENGRWIGRGNDIGEVAHPWRDNVPWRWPFLAIADMRSVRSIKPLAARTAYHAGILTGLVRRRSAPTEHWK